MIFEPKILGTFVVGSRLHNLHNDDSDFDYRGVHISPLISHLSPFQKPKNTVWIEGDVDNTSFELTDFCRLAVYGNPTILEILFSNIIKLTTPAMEELRLNRHKFLDSTRIFEAAKGYANNQYNKMSLFTPDKRTPKFAVAYLRTLWQNTEFLKTGELPVQVTGQMRDFLYKIKYYDYNKFSEITPQLVSEFTKWQVELANSYYQNHQKFQPDINWIENFILKTYQNQ